MNSAKELWQQALSNLEFTTSAVNFDVWIKTLEPVNITDSKLVLLASNEKIKSFVYDKFKDVIYAAVVLANPLMTDIVFIDPSEAEVFMSKGETFVIEEPKITIPVTTINPKYNFENFVVGSSNKFLFAAANAVADEPGTRYNPLFIYGGAGLGKTHIMHAIANAVKVSHPGLKVLYVSSDRFVNEFIASIRATKSKSGEFREKYRNVDILMIDDIQFIVGKPETQNELFHTFNELYQMNKQLVFTSDKPPKEIPDIEERLSSRFEWGLIADVQPPDLETRIAILQKKAQIEKYNIPLDVLEFMAEKMSGNIRDMESLLNKVIFLSRLYEVAPNVSLVQEALKDYSVKTEESLSADVIIDCACRYFNVSREDLIGKKKNREIVEPRQICIYVINDILSPPLATIGNLFGGRDHTTIMHARDKVTVALNTSPKTRTAVNDIKNMVLKK